MATNETGAADTDDAIADDDRPGPESGGCLNFGWGCLPVLAGVLLILPRLFF